MFKNPASGVVALCLTLLTGFLLGYATKPIPEPAIDVKPILHQPWVEVRVNGKLVDLSKVKFGPAEPDKGKKKSGDLPSGDLPPNARPSPDDAGCSCKPCTCTPCKCKISAECPCDPCDCGSCACHLTKAISTSQAIEQRGDGNRKSPELLGIETLVAVLNKFHDSLFGTGNKPGLRDDIANGLKDFYASLRTGVIVAGGLIFGLLGWMALSLQRIADAQAKSVTRPG